MDGNVERVYARLADDASADATLHRAAWRWAEANLHAPRPGDWNQALMELGATVCTPKNPACERCPLKGECLAYARGTQALRPAPAKRRDTVELKQAVWVPESEGMYGLRQIPAGEWWEGMWEFPRAVPLAEDEAALGGDRRRWLAARRRASCATA